ncbi:hypothetical protein DPMN_166700 [Dreissena polymorpha]|uniref:Uncharacterized protein n=1 Tax=Dreissena polymorpha TaxID=45954 RepID=A0A9D4IVP8_DREPO|nr:hypothetical protein DPMN_166700 [Dreissena polymorpha]
MQVAEQVKTSGSVKCHDGQNQNDRARMQGFENCNHCSVILHSIDRRKEGEADCKPVS